MAQRLVKVATVVLDGSGNGTATLVPDGGDWRVTITTVKVATNTLEAQANTYLNTIGDSGLIEGTYLGSSGDTSDTTFIVARGEPLYCVWTGGDPGALATLRVQGWLGQPGEFSGS